MRVRVMISLALTFSVLVIGTGSRTPAFADDVVNEKVSVKEPGLTNDGAQIVVDESGTTSVGGHTSLSGVTEVEAKIEIGGPETVSGHASVGTDAQGFGCTIEDLDSGHCETF